MKILVMSCDKNIDLFEPFYLCMEKYWPDHPEIIYCTETINNPYYKTINKNYEITQWTKRVREAVCEINDDYIILCVDDIFIRDYVNTNLINSLITYFNANIAAINLEQVWNINDKKLNKYVCKREQKAKYKNSVMCQIWSKEKLLKVMSWDTDPWTFEKTNKDFGFDYLICTKQFIDWGYYDKKWFALKSGKWCKECLNFFKEENIKIDYKKRGVWDE